MLSSTGIKVSDDIYVLYTIFNVCGLKSYQTKLKRHFLGSCEWNPAYLKYNFLQRILTLRRPFNILGHKTSERVLNALISSVTSFLPFE